MGQGSWRDRFLPVQRRTDREDLLTLESRGLGRSAARQRQWPQRCNCLRVNPQDRDITLGVCQQDVSRQLDGGCQLHLDRSGSADPTLVRRDQSLRIDHESGRVRRRGPQRDDAVLPLHQKRGGISVGGNAAGGGRGRGRFDFGVARGQLEDGIAPGTDVDHLHPLIRLTCKCDWPIRFHGVVTWRQAQLCGPIECGDNAARRRTGGVVADQQYVVWHRRRFAVRVGQDDLDVENARRLI
jgi:hypothetical protein